IGDKVKVLRKSTYEEYDLWHDLWMPEMNKSIGNEYTIIKCIPNEITWGAEYCKYRLDDSTHLNFPEFVLQGTDIPIGQQLEFPFMSAMDGI
ncbi:unnamed protein product, partial [marine sediment metagenome]